MLSLIPDRRPRWDVKLDWLSRPSIKPFDEWTSIFGNQRLTGALLDRLTHHVHILEMNGESYRLKQSKARRRKNSIPTAEPLADPETGEITPG
jgi:hypothetical protein